MRLKKSNFSTLPAHKDCKFCTQLLKRHSVQFVYARCKTVLHQSEGTVDVVVGESILCYPLATSRPGNPPPHTTSGPSPPLSTHGESSCYRFSAWPEIAQNDSDTQERFDTITTDYDNWYQVECKYFIGFDV